MQLTIEVLPAPLGPMIENNSPSLTPKLTSVSARTPPKRSDTPRTSNVLATHFLQIRRLGSALDLSFAILHRQHPPSHPTNDVGCPRGVRHLGRQECMRGNAAPGRSRMPSARRLDGRPADARWLSIMESDTLKCLVPDNWSANFDA